MHWFDNENYSNSINKHSTKYLQSKNRFLCIYLLVLLILNMIENLSSFSLNSNQFDKVIPAFLEFASPSIPEAIEMCSKIGAKKVTILPYFLSAGVHINRDIPEEVNKASQNFPNLEIKVTSYFGSRDEIAELLMKTAIEG